MSVFQNHEAQFPKSESGSLQAFLFLKFSILCVYGYFASMDVWALWAIVPVRAIRGGGILGTGVLGGCEPHCGCL